MIVVDDNSDPEKVDFNHFPQWKGTHYELYLTKEGKGAGYARNVGLEYAKGEWVLFADADDYFLSDNLNRLFEMDIPDGENVVLYQFKFYLKDGSFFIYPDIQALKDSAVDSLVVSYDTNELCRNAVMPWAKMVRRSHLNHHNIRFDEIKWGNDMIYSTKLSLSVDSFRIAPLLVYSHEWFPSSLVNKEQGLEMYYQRALLSLQRAVLLHRRGKLNYNLFTDQWFLKVYSLSFFKSVWLKIRSFLQLGPHYCVDNWRQFTRKPLYLTRLFVKRLIKEA